MAQNAAWLVQQQEIERTEAMGSRIPAPLADTCDALFKRLGYGQRIAVLKMMDSIGFDLSSCSTLCSVMNDCPSEKLNELVLLLSSWTCSLLTTLALLGGLGTHGIDAFLACSSDERTLILDMCRVCESDDILLLPTNMNTLTLPVHNRILNACKDFKTKACGLCRLKRIRTLEDKLLHNEVPSSNLAVPGTVELFDVKHDIDTHAQASGVSFRLIIDDQDEVKECSIQYNSAHVDLVSICDKCLGDVNAAVCVSNRHIEVFHLRPEQRRDVICALRIQERSMAFMIEIMNRERQCRRAKEHCLKLWSIYRRALQSELEQRMRVEAEKRMCTQMEEAKSMKAQLIDASYSHWSKWKTQDDAALDLSLRLRQTRAEVDYHIPFGASGFEHMSPAREHEHSWRQTNFGEQRYNLLVPITAQGASEIFGTAIPSPDIRTQELAQWKDALVASMSEYDAMNREKERIEQERKQRELDALMNYVDGRLMSIELRDYQKKMDASMENERHQERRKNARAERYAQRIRGYETRERELMAAEDFLAWKLRALMHEQLCEARELVRMRTEESKQCRVDLYWGIDVDERLRREEEERRRRAYEALVEDLRVTCVKVKIIRPKEIEVRRKVYRDRITGRVLT